MVDLHCIALMPLDPLSKTLYGIAFLRTEHLSELNVIPHHTVFDLHHCAAVVPHWNVISASAVTGQQCKVCINVTKWRVCVCVYLRLSWSSSAWRTAPVMGSTVIASPGFTPRMHCVSGIRPTFLPGNWAAGHATHTYTHTRTHTPEWDRDRQTEAETQEECTSS